MFIKTIMFFVVISVFLWAQDVTLDPKVENWLDQLSKAKDETAQKIILDDISKVGIAGLDIFIPALQSSKKSMQIAAIECLSKMEKMAGSNIKIMSALLQISLDGLDKDLKACSQKAIKTIDMHGFDSLLVLTENSNSKIQEGSIACLTDMEDKAVQALLQGISGKNTDIRKKSIKVLGHFSKQADKITKPLLQIVVYEIRVISIQEMAKKSLLKLQAHTLPVLQQELKNPEWRMRKGSVKILGDLGKIAMPASQDVIIALKDPHPDVATEAKIAYRKIAGVDMSGQNTLDAYITDLQSPAPEIRRNAIRKLGEMGHKAGSAIEAIGQYIENSMKSAGNRELLEEAFLSLEKIGANSISCLIQILQNGMDPMGRSLAAHTLGNMGESGKKAIPELVKAMQDPNWRVREYAGKSLEKLVDAKSLSTLIAKLQDPDVKVRIATINVLGSLGKKASSAKAIIQDMSTKDSDLKVRIAAKETLKKL